MPKLAGSTAVMALVPSIFSRPLMSVEDAYPLELLNLPACTNLASEVFYNDVALLFTIMNPINIAFYYMLLKTLNDSE